MCLKIWSSSPESSKLRWRHNKPIFLDAWVTPYCGVKVWLHTHHWACIHGTNTGNDISSTLCGHININLCFRTRMSYHLENIIVSWQVILETGRHKRKILPLMAWCCYSFPVWKAGCWANTLLLLQLRKQVPYQTFKIFCQQFLYLLLRWNLDSPITYSYYSE